MKDHLQALSYKLRRDVPDMIYGAKTGHIGGAFSVMEIPVSLYMKEMNINPENQDQPEDLRKTSGWCSFKVIY